MKSICVFLGSSPGRLPEYRQAAVHLGEELAGRGLRLIYGGGSIGLMTVIADRVLAEGGEVIGVIPQALVDKEVAHLGLTDLRIVGSMHERKALMADLADGFIALPGGMGTLEELCEILTWAQLGLHRKPCGLLDIAGYYDGLKRFFDHMVEERFLREEHRRLLLIAQDAGELLDQFEQFQPVQLPKWMDGPVPPAIR
ncbi:MAG: TIGR00730 family Rossman fold protein [Pirellulales bacterium]|nr:TIGR00730 family Rossman fold protein [Pirellulales bacterium]